MRVVHFQRKRLPGVSFSIESEFDAIRAELAGDERFSVDVVENRLTNFGAWRWAINGLDVRRSRGDVNHITGDVHYLAWALPARRTVLTVHDCGFEDRLEQGLRRRVALAALLRAPVKRVAVVTVPSTFTRDRVVELCGVTPDDVRIVPLCISSALARLPRATDGPPTVLTVGTMENKNLDRIVAAVAGLNAQLHLVGVLTDAQQSMLHSSGLEWHNSVGITNEELARAYAAADVLAFASTYEGFGMPIIEAQTVGCPVLTSTVASMPEAAGVGACLVDPYDVDAIRAGLRRLLEEPAFRDELIFAGFENARRFSPALSAAAFAEIYCEVGGSRST